MSAIPFNEVVLPLSAALGLSAFVERILEFFKNFLEPRIGAEGARLAPDVERPERSLAALEAALKDGKDPDVREDLPEGVPPSVALVTPATPPDGRAALRSVILHLLGFASGILLARLAGIRLFSALHADLPVTGGVALDYIFTGLLIGGGSGPFHLLLRFVTDRKVAVDEPADQAEPAAKETDNRGQLAAVAAGTSLVAVAADATAQDWPDLQYDGGVDRELLEHTHQRNAPVHLVVYHHTAMAQSSTFADVVNVIKSRKDSGGRPWLTGYHCVVLADGSIHPFCRWDRAGSHAAGVNGRSLGIAFNGNFETDPKVPFSNPTGRYGPPRPTTAQLEAGAKVVALWTFLYPGIALDFQDHIIPHTRVPGANKPCPGSQFPYEQFQKLVVHYRQTWSQSPFVQERIAAFRLKPNLYDSRARGAPAPAPALQPPASRIVPAAALAPPAPGAPTPGSAHP